ncbi:MAG: type II secretion system F family protein [Candidatus Aenigmarchaeota archaeon]|nr:type II secretion system F family protein [Candidatus Aenigmarchaeota archaeon]
MDSENRILVFSGAAAAAMITIAIIFSPSAAVSFNMILAAVLILAVPYSAFKFVELKRIKAYENEFPNFLRDIAESQRAGLSIIEAIKTASKSEYGALTKELRKMSDQLSWNVPLEKVLKKFSHKMGKSDIIRRSIIIIMQANKSGGNIEDVMESLASNIESIKDVQQEKSLMLNQQVVMMYAIFFIFLGITLALIKFLIPLLQTQNQIGGFVVLENFNSNPCAICVASPDSMCIGCHAFFLVSDSFDLGKREEASAYYKSLFLTMIMIQGLFTGLIAGQISNDSVVAGLKHSLLMLISGFSIFMVVTKLGLV